MCAATRDLPRGLSSDVSGLEWQQGCLALPASPLPPPIMQLIKALQRQVFKNTEVAIRRQEEA